MIQDSHSGLLVQAGDANGFAQAMLSLLDDSVKRGRLGQNARQQAIKLHTWEQYTSQLEQIYLGVVP